MMFVSEGPTGSYVKVDLLETDTRDSVIYSMKGCKFGMVIGEYPAWVQNHPLCQTVEDAEKLWERAWETFWSRRAMNEMHKQAQRAFEEKNKHELRLIKGRKASWR